MMAGESGAVTPRRMRRSGFQTPQNAAYNYQQQLDRIRMIQQSKSRTRIQSGAPSRQEAQMYSMRHPGIENQHPHKRNIPSGYRGPTVIDLDSGADRMGPRGSGGSHLSKRQEPSRYYGGRDMSRYASTRDSLNSMRSSRGGPGGSVNMIDMARKQHKR